MKFDLLLIEKCRILQVGKKPQIERNKKMGRPKTVVTANQVRSIVSKYNKGAGLLDLSIEFDYSVPVIRRVLREKRVRVRKRGRPALSV